MPAEIQTKIWGDRFDAWTTLWLIDHLSIRLETWNWDPITTDILFPIGYNLWSFGHMALQLIGAFFVTLGIPLVVSYNLLLLGGIWTSALATHALAHELTRSHRAAFVAGTTFATTPYLYAEGGSGCIELVAAGLIPLYVLSLVRLTRRPSIRRGITATLVLAVIGLFNWYYTLFAGMFGLAFLGWQIIEIGPRRLRAPVCASHRKGLSLVLISMVCAAVLNAPLISEARRETPERPGISAELFADETVFTEVRSVTNGSYDIAKLNEDMLKRVDALQVHFNSTSVRALVEGQFEVNPLHSTPGTLAYVVGVFGLIAAGRRTWGWIAIATGSTVLTLGPFLNVSGALLLTPAAADWPLPYHWAHEHLPFFSKAYRPYRIGIIASTALAVSGAVGAAAWIRSNTMPSFKPILVLLGLAAFSQPHWSGERPSKRPLADATIQDIYTELAQLEPGAVIELPLQYQPVTTANARTQYNQTVHRHPILNSNQLIRRTDLLRFRDFVTHNSVLHTFVDLSRSDPPYVVKSRDIEDLQKQGFRWIVAHRIIPDDTVSLAGEMVHADLLPIEAWQLLETMFGAPIVDNGESVIWDMQQASLQAEVIRVDGHNTIDLGLIFDPVETGFPLVLFPGQSTSVYEGNMTRFTAWVHLEQENGEANLRIEDEGIVREEPLPIQAGHWTYIDIPIQGQGEIRLKIVGRGDTPIRLHITQAKVVK